MSARDDAGRRQALAWRALARGELVQPEWIDGESAIGSMAMKEAQAQGNDANFLALAARQFPPTDWSIEAARGKPIRSLEYLIWPALSPSLMQQHGDAIRAQLDAIAPEMQKIPATSMPFPHGAWALTLSLLHGDVDGAMARLEVMSTLSPLVWEPLLVSPSGREMPFMQLVRAHPKFAKILANRDALIARERARIRTLRPDLK
jgi:hypothetical protein